MPARKFRRQSDRQRRRSQQGAVAVEFALILPLLAMLLFGIVTAGLALSQAVGLSNAVREGSRFAAISPYPPAAGDWASDVIERTRSTQFDDPGSTTRVCVDLYRKANAAATPPVLGGIIKSGCDGPNIASPPAFSAPSNMPPGSCVTRVWGARKFTINAILVRFPDRVMTRQAIAVYERTPCGT